MISSLDVEDVDTAQRATFVLPKVRAQHAQHLPRWTHRAALHEAPVIVTVETSQEPMPIVSPTSPQSSTILNSSLGISPCKALT